MEDCATRNADSPHSKAGMDRRRRWSLAPKMHGCMIFPSMRERFFAHSALLRVPRRYLGDRLGHRSPYDDKYGVVVILGPRHEQARVGCMIRRPGSARQNQRFGGLQWSSTYQFSLRRRVLGGKGERGSVCMTHERCIDRSCSTVAVENCEHSSIMSILVTKTHPCISSECPDPPEL